MPTLRRLYARSCQAAHWGDLVGQESWSRDRQTSIALLCMARRFVLTMFRDDIENRLHYVSDVPDLTVIIEVYHVWLARVTHRLQLTQMLRRAHQSPSAQRHPRPCLFTLLRTLNALPQPACGQRNGFSPVCEWLWILRHEGREKALLQVWQI